MTPRSDCARDEPREPTVEEALRTLGVADAADRVDCDHAYAQLLKKSPPHQAAAAFVRLRDAHAVAIARFPEADAAFPLPAYLEVLATSEQALRERHLDEAAGTLGEALGVEDEPVGPLLPLSVHLYFSMQADGNLAGAHRLLERLRVAVAHAESEEEAVGVFGPSYERAKELGRVSPLVSGAMVCALADAILRSDFAEVRRALDLADSATRIAMAEQAPRLFADASGSKPAHPRKTQSGRRLAVLGGIFVVLYAIFRLVVRAPLPQGASVSQVPADAIPVVEAIHVFDDKVLALSPRTDVLHGKVDTLRADLAGKNCSVILGDLRAIDFEYERLGVSDETVVLPSLQSLRKAVRLYCP